MLSVLTLPVVMALSSALPAPTQLAPASAFARLTAGKTAPVDFITCPLNGDKIPSCCCPVKK